LKNSLISKRLLNYDYLLLDIANYLDITSFFLFVHIFFDEFRNENDFFFLIFFLDKNDVVAYPRNIGNRFPHFISELMDSAGLESFFFIVKEDI